MRMKAPAMVVAILLFAAALLLFGQSDSSKDNSTFLDGWFTRVADTQSEQPHWITPLATTTPRLEQEFRYDFLWLPKADGTIMKNYGGGKGLEIIPSRNIEVIVGLPPYLEHNQPGVRNGFGDLSMLVKYRLLSANEEKGDYILTAFLGVSFPTSSSGNGVQHAVVTPTIAYGKGFGNFDLQGTWGVSFPTRDTEVIGRTYSWNNTFQYRILHKLWPELEVNTAFFQKGKFAGQKQVFFTPGLVIGKIPLHQRLGLTVGAGVQIATTRFHTSNHNIILSVRLPF
jgi:hypothetical protein